MSPDSVKAVFGLPVWNREQFVAESLESLLAQTRRDHAIVVVDDCSSDGTASIVEGYTRLDPRITLTRNDVRQGLLGTWNQTFRLARQLYPLAPYFAWASDHDLWHPRWLDATTSALDEYPDVVLAYSRSVRISDEGDIIRQPWSFETVGEASPGRRLRAAVAGMSAGSMIYGLFRADVLERAGVYPPVIKPDRVVLAELALYGQFRQVPEVLWYRRFGGLWSAARARRSLFPNGAPRYCYLPAVLTHTARMAWRLSLRGYGRPEISALAGGRYALQYLALSVVGASLRQIRRASKLARKPLGRWKNATRLSRRTPQGP